MKYICSIIIIQITVVVLFAGIAFAERNPKSLCTILEKAEIVVSGEIIKITGSDTIRGKHTATIKVSEILKGSLSGHEINFSWVTIDIVTSEQEPGRDIRIGTKGIWILGKEGNRDYLSMYFYTGYQSMEKIDDIKCLLTMGNERKKETPGSDLMLKIVNEYSKIPGLDKMYGYGKLDNIK